MRPLPVLGGGGVGNEASGSAVPSMAEVEPLPTSKSAAEEIYRSSSHHRTMPNLLCKSTRASCHTVAFSGFGLVVNRCGVCPASLWLSFIGSQLILVTPRPSRATCCSDRSPPRLDACRRSHDSVSISNASCLDLLAAFVSFLLLGVVPYVVSSVVSYVVLCLVCALWYEERKVAQQCPVCTEMR